MEMQTVAKIGSGTSEDPFRPNTDVESWRVIEERENEFVIEVLSAD